MKKVTTKGKTNPKCDDSTQPQPQPKGNGNGNTEISQTQKPPPWRFGLDAGPVERSERMSLAERTNLKQWVAGVLGASVNQADIELRSGVVFCQLIDQIYPGSIDMSSIKLQAKMVHERSHNRDLLVVALMQQQSEMDVAEITKRLGGTGNDLFEFLKYLRDLHVATVPAKPEVVVVAPQMKKPKSKKKHLAKVAPKTETAAASYNRCDTLDSTETCALEFQTNGGQSNLMEILEEPKPVESILQKLFNRQDFKRALASHLSALDESSSDEDDEETIDARRQRRKDSLVDIFMAFKQLTKAEIEASGGVCTEEDVVLEIIDDLRKLRIEIEDHYPEGYRKSLLALHSAFIRGFKKFVGIYGISADTTTIPAVIEDEVMPVDRYPHLKIRKAFRLWFPEHHPETMVQQKSMQHLPMLAKGQTLPDLLKKTKTVRPEEPADPSTGPKAQKPTMKSSRGTMSRRGKAGTRRKVLPGDAGRRLSIGSPAAAKQVQQFVPVVNSPRASDMGRASAKDLHETESGHPLNFWISLEEQQQQISAQGTTEVETPPGNDNCQKEALQESQILTPESQSELIILPAEKSSMEVSCSTKEQAIPL